ncbi:MAG: nicotinate-nucleotide adenylyltransferase [Acidimicrobiales bacterium]
MSAPGERLGVFGGTFDPVHIGHLVAAVNALHVVSLDRVALVVANIPWQKQGSRHICSAEDRLAMVQAAVAEVDGLEACDIEIRRGGESVTADTLQTLHAQDPSRRLFLIVGADAAAGLPTWRRLDEVRSLAELVIVDRPGGSPLPEVGEWSAHRVEIPLLGISSSDLRARAAQGRPLRFLVPEPVRALIEERMLYRLDGDGD